MRIGCAMPEYRFYTIDKSGHITRPPEGHDLPNDAAANEKARRLLDDRDIEIWQGSRVVVYLVPEQKAG